MKLKKAFDKIRKNKKTGLELRKGRMMSYVGILGNRDEEKERIRHLMEELSKEADLEYLILSSEEEAMKEESEISCVILAFRNREFSFERAEFLWSKKSSIHIIYVAYDIGDIFSALRMPFFHIVRYFDMEEDLRAAFRKMGRSNISFSERIGFLKNGKTIVLSRREILYVESIQHEISIHTIGEVFSITETLRECEKKLKNQGFIKIDRSFLVNMYQVRLLEKGRVLLTNGEYLYVSRRRYGEVKAKFEKYIRHLDFI